MVDDDFSYRDALPTGPAHRRGAGINPGNRFESVRLHVLGEELDRQWIEREGEDGRLQRVERHVYLDRTQKIINRVAKTSDVPFDWTLNPYRGCEHGCIYCFARPYHEYLGFSSGLDFETKLMAKPDAAKLLRQELAKPSWKPEPIVMSAITDIYQPIEHKMRIARQCLEVMVECGQPVTTMTKSSLVLRDTDLWSRLAQMNAGARDHHAGHAGRRTRPEARARGPPHLPADCAIRELTKAGIHVTVNVAPIIHGLTDTELPRILDADAEARQGAAWVLLRLPYQLKDIFLDWLKRSVHPDRARKVESLIRQARGGKLYEAGFKRGRGHGAAVDQLAQTFDVFTRKYGLNRDIRPLSTAHFRRPDTSGQMPLF